MGIRTQLAAYQPSRLSIPVLLAAAIERLYKLNVGITPLKKVSLHKKPHKPFDFFLFRN
jgi:hypothetical protein